MKQEYRRPRRLRNADGTDYPARLRHRLGRDAPNMLGTLGNLLLLTVPQLALFCSVRCPPAKAAQAVQRALQLREQGAAVVSGFHSPVEKECLRILLQGRQPIIICLLRPVERIRVPLGWRAPLDEGRLLLLSHVALPARRPDRRDAHRRNELAAALADEVLVIHAEPGGSIARLTPLLERWEIPQRRLDD